MLFAGISASPAAAQYSPYAGRATSVTTATTPSVEIDLSVLDDVKPAAKPGALKLHLPATAQREPVAEQPGNRIVLVKPSSSGQVAALTPHKSRPKPAEHTVKLATLPSRHRHVHPKVQLAERSGAAKPPYGESRHAAPAAPVEQAAATPPKAAPHKPAAGKTAVARNIEPDGGQAPASPAQPAPAKKAPPAGKSTTVVQTSASRPEQAPAPMPAQVPAAPQQTASAAPPKAAPAPQPKAAAPAPQSAPVVAAQSSSQPASSQPASSQPASPASPPASAGPGDQLASLPDAGTSRLLFPAGATDVPDTAKAQLVTLAKQLGDRSTLRLQLSAYAAGTPDSASPARRVSLARALAVRSFLVDQGIHSSRIDVRALGNSTASGSGPADRVDIAVIDR